MFDWLNNAGNLAIAITAICGVAGGAIAFACKAYSKLREIYQEVVPNGGTSLRDAINRIEGRQVVADQRHQAVVSLTDIAMFESDAGGRCVWANRAYLRMVDKSLNDIQGNGWVNIVHPMDRDRVFEEWQKAVVQNREFGMRYRVVCSEGEETHVLCQTAIMRNIKGELIGYQGSLIVTKPVAA